MTAAVSTTTTLHEIKTLLASRHPLVVLDSVEEDRVRDLVAAAATQLGLPMFEWSVTQGLRRSEDREDISGITAEPGKLLAHLAGMRVRAVFLAHDLHAHLTDPKTERLLRDLLPRLSENGATLVLAGADIELPEALETDAVRVPVSLPSCDEIAAALTVLIAATGATAEPGALPAAAEALQGLTLNQARQAAATALLNGSLDLADVADLTERKVRAIADGGLLEYHPAADNHARLAGMAGLKAWLERAHVAFTPQARALNITTPRGILLAGVPGCGKSLAAKHVARVWRRPLLKLDAASLYDKYVGESERNLRSALDMAEALAPVVLWIDEIEKGLAVGGGDDGGAVARRMLGSLLTWMQERRHDVFVVATCNDLTVLPPELQRKGRFDEVFFVDLPHPDERAAIFATQLALRRQSRDRFELAPLVAASDGFSGAEIEQAVVSGILRALHARRVPGTRDVLDELAATSPLSRSRPEAVAAIRERARDFVPAS